MDRILHFVQYHLSIFSHFRSFRSRHTQSRPIPQLPRHGTQPFTPRYILRDTNRLCGIVTRYAVHVRRGAHTRWTGVLSARGQLIRIKFGACAQFIAFVSRTQESPACCESVSKREMLVGVDLAGTCTDIDPAWKTVKAPIRGTAAVAGR